MKTPHNQKTYIPLEKDLDNPKGKHAKTWLLIDVNGLTLGITATKIADLLRGKQKVYFTPQYDCGDYIVVINARNIRLAGDKMSTKEYHWHTGYGAGFRTRTAREVMEKKPEKVLEDAVSGMLPRNRLRKHLMRKLFIYPDAEHEHKAQSPKIIKL